MIYKGIDVSEFQNPKNINYNELCKNIDFAIIRAGFTGTTTGVMCVEDKHFATHYAELKQRGIAVGAYWYSCADNVKEGQAEAEAFYNVVKGKQFEMPLYIDTEDTIHQAKQKPSLLTDTVIAFCETLEAKGYYVGIYASQYWFNTRLQLVRLKPFDLWVANWDIETRPMTAQAGVWQYSSRGQIKGYVGNLDLNYAYKDYKNIMKEAKLNGFIDRVTRITATKTETGMAAIDQEISALKAKGYEVKTELI